MTPEQKLAAIRALPAITEPNGMQWLDAQDVADILETDDGHRHRFPPARYGVWPCSCGITKAELNA